MKRITLSLPAPYVGLRPFTEAEALLFFGRDAHVRDLLAKLERQQRFLAVLGASGSGKSSLVRAGLIPALHRGALHARPVADGEPVTDIPHWNVCIFTPGNAPLAHLAQALTADERWIDSASRADAESSLASLLGTSPLALAELYRQRADRFVGEALLLVVDQFEELFRYRQRNPDEADSFVKLLLRSAGEDLPIYVVMTMRSDFLGNAVAFHGLAEAINSGIYLTPRLGSEQIRSVITAPLALVGGSIAPVLANRLVNTLSGEDELPVLQHALLRMWLRARASGRSAIDDDDFLAVCAPRDKPGGVPGEPQLSFAIDNHASDIYDALTPFQRKIARQFFLALAERRDGRDVRRPQTLTELRAQVGNDAQDALMVVIEAYRAQGVGFVLPAAGQPLQPDDLIDIGHESLIRRWQHFQTWLGEEDLDVADLREWLHRARRSEERGGWLDQNDGDRALAWRARVVERSNPGLWAERFTGAGSYERVDAYIQASLERLNQAKVEKEALRRDAEEARIKRFEVEAQMQRQATERAEADKARAENETAQALAMAAVNRSRSRIAIAGGVAAFVFAVVAGVFGFQAQRAKHNAEALTLTAQAGEMAATAEGLGKDFPDLSLLLALEARRIAPVPKANALLRAAQAGYPYRVALRGHEGPVTSVQFSADGKTVLTASIDKTARLWDVVSGKEFRALRGHEDGITSAQFSADGKTVLTAGDDKTARLWDVASGQELRALRGHENRVNSAQFSADGKTVVTASEDKTARLWEVASGEELRSLRGHEHNVTSAQFSADGKTVLTASYDATARLWNVASGEELRALRGHDGGSVTSAQFSADGKTVLTASEDKTARLWDVASGKELRALRGHVSVVTSAQFSADGKRVLTVSRDRTARLWHVASGKELRVLGHEDEVTGAQFSADGKTVLTAGYDNTARLWDVDSDKELHALRGHELFVTGAQFSADGKTVLTEGYDNTARLWDVASGKELRALRGHGGPVTSAQFSADGKTVLTASLDSTARLWDVATGKELRALRGHEDHVYSAHFSADGKTLLTASADRTARLWDVASGQELRALRGHGNNVYSAQFSADGKTVLTASYDATARLWDVASGEELRALRGHDGSVTSAQFSADGKTVLTVSVDKTARLWDVASGKELRALRGHAREVSSAQFSADGKMVLTASGDRSAQAPSADWTARLWDVASGKELRALRGHEESVTSAQFSADGKTVLTASHDNTARLWDVASGKELRALRGHEDQVTSAQFSPDGKTVLTTSYDETARLWDCPECRPMEEIAREVARKVGRELTADERLRFGLPSCLPLVDDRNPPSYDDQLSADPNKANCASTGSGCPVRRARWISCQK